MRNLEGYPVQWEAFLVLRSLHAMSTNTVSEDLLEWFSTDEYRAILPIYFAAIISQITKSYLVGITVTEVAWWWFGAIGVFILTRYFSSTSIAYFAGLLTCFSPLGAGHIGSAHLHTASSLSLSVFLAIIWVLFHDTRYDLFFASLLFGLCVFISSITYTYQWFLIPFFFLLALFTNEIKRRIILWLLGTVIFVIIRFTSYALLGISGLYVHSHQNDPIRVLFSRLEIAFQSADFASLFAQVFVAKLSVIFDIYLTSYSGVVVATAVIGALLLRNNYQKLIFATGIVLSILFGAIYGIPWVIMCAYPMVYALTAQCVSRVHCYLLAMIPLGPLSVLKSPPLVFLKQFIIITLIGLLTNLDILGDSSFTIMWWRGWYEPH